jgi:hypothetical protein
MGLTMQEKKAVTRQVRSRYKKAGRKEKSVILDEFIKTTGCKNRKYALRILNKPETAESLLFTKGKAVRLSPPKKRPANRKGKKIYTDEVIAVLRLIWAFFWHKCGKILAPFMRQQMPFIALWPAFGVTPEIREKLMRISPGTRFRGGDHRPRPQKRQGRPRPKANPSPNPVNSSNTASPYGRFTPVRSGNCPLLSKSTPFATADRPLRASISSL